MKSLVRDRALVQRCRHGSASLVDAGELFGSSRGLFGLLQDTWLGQRNQSVSVVRETLERFIRDKEIAFRTMKDTRASQELLEGLRRNKAEAGAALTRVCRRVTAKGLPRSSTSLTCSCDGPSSTPAARQPMHSPGNSCANSV